MECPLWRLLISFRSVSKHGHHMQFLFLIGRFLKKSSPLKLLSHMNRNLVGSIYMYRGSFLDRNIGIVFGIELLHLIQTMFSASTTGSFTPLHANWLVLRIDSKGPTIYLENNMNWILVGSIYGRSSMKIAHFVSISRQTWPPHAILVSDWSIFKKIFSLLFQSYWVFRICSVSSAFLDRNIGIVFGIELLHLIQTMFSASTTGSFTPLHANWLVLRIDRSSMKIAHFVSISRQTWPPHAILVSDWSIFKKIFSFETA
jgi:hypothetical protein